MSDFQLQEPRVMFHIYVVLPVSQSILKWLFYKFRTMIMDIFMMHPRSLITCGIPWNIIGPLSIEIPPFHWIAIARPILD